jgi:hypothetical protein
MDDLYSQEIIEDEDLHEFANAALKHLRYYEYMKGFEGSLVLIALCQGGALHYCINHGYAKKYFPPTKGLKDIDIWFFFKSEHGRKDFWHRRRNPGRNINTSKFGERKMDTFGRSIQFNNIDEFEAVKKSVNQWLKDNSKKPSPRFLLEKAGVAIYPKNFCGKVLWLNPELK